MPELLKNMLKEEWRVHSTLLGNIRFGLFPLLIAVFAFLGCLAISIFDLMFSKTSMVIFVHYLFFFFGINVGAFGLMGKEFMNRRFGQASLVAYSSRTLPVGERIIFLNVVIKDILYYFFLWIIPIIAGFTIAVPILNVNFAYVPLFLLTLSLSFLIGLSITFFLSMLYARSGRWLVLIVLLLAVAASFFTKNILVMFPPYVYFASKDLGQIWISLMLILIPSALATIFVKFDFPEKKDKFENSLRPLSMFFSFSKYSIFVAKDILDIRRSDGGFGKIFFSFMLPMAFIWVFLGFLTSIITTINFLVLFAIFLGVFSSTVYTWLTEYDLFNQYLFLPVKVSTVMKSKMIGYVTINLISILLLIFAAIVKGQMLYLLPALILFAITSFFALSITILYTGLSPSIMFMDIRVLVKYLLTVMPLMLGLIFIYLFGAIYLIVGVLVLFAAAILIMKRAFKKWDALPQQTF